MGLAKIRSQFIATKQADSSLNEETKRLLSNGFIPESLKQEFNDYAAANPDITPDDDIDLITNGNYFANNPNNVFGETVEGSGFLNPVKVIGNIEDAVSGLNQVLENTQEAKQEPVPEPAPVEQKPEPLKTQDTTPTEPQTSQPVKETKKMANDKKEVTPTIGFTNADLAIIAKKNLLVDDKDKKKTTTVEESIERLNAGISEDEIIAWVWYKRQFGNPMKGWEKYFITGQNSGDQNILIQTTTETTLKDNHLRDLSVVPTDTILGKRTKFTLNHSKDSSYIVVRTETNELIYVDKAHVKEIKNKTEASAEDLQRLVLANALIYDGNDHFPVPVYLFGDIYSKIRILNDNKELIVNKYGQEIFDAQLKQTESYKPKLRSFREPVKSKRPHILSLSEFANSTEQFGILGLNDETNVKLGEHKRGRFKETEEKQTLFDAFKTWVNDAVKDTDLKGTTKLNISLYYWAKSIRWAKNEDGSFVLSKSERDELVGSARIASENLFSDFLQQCLIEEDAIRLDVIWNEKYNTFTNINDFVNKIPVAYAGSTMFKSGDLGIRSAQRHGLAFLQLVGSGCISYDVGFGKTLVGILNLAQLMAQGKVKRPLVVVPKPTYKNWLRELFGYWTDGDKIDFNEFKGATYHYGVLSGSNIKLNDWYNLSGKHYEKLLAQNNNDLNKLIPENTVTVVSYKGLEQMGFSREMSNEMVESISAVIQQKDAENAKEAVVFNEKVQGWLGLGNKNAILMVDKVGFDHLTVDEAHNFKNVFTACGKDATTGRKLFGIQASQSGRAVKLFFITQYLQRKYGKNVVLLTATPFTNSPLEMYSMLSFIGLDTLNQYNLYNIKKFFENFILETIEYAINATGQIVTKPVIKSFQNLKLLQTILYNHFDYKDNPKEAGVVRPCLVNIPNKEMNTYIAMNEWQIENQVLVVEEAKSASKENQGAMLRAMGMSLNNALSPFLVRKEQPKNAAEFVDKSPKIKYAVECIRTLLEYHESRNEDMSGVIVYSSRGDSYFDYIKEYLLSDVGFKRGVIYDDEVMDEVEILRGGGSEADDDWKELVKDAFNAGIVKIIIGTSTIKEGINLQTRSAVTFNLTPDWNPNGIRQLAGRNWRQGNRFGYVRFVTPLVINSMDSFIWQKQDEKSKRISSLWNSLGDSNVEEVSSELDPSEIKYELIQNAEEKFKIKHGTVVAEATRLLEVSKEAQDTIKWADRSVNELRERADNMYAEFKENANKWSEYLVLLKGQVMKIAKSNDDAKFMRKLRDCIDNTDNLIRDYNEFKSTGKTDIELLLKINRNLAYKSRYFLETNESNWQRQIAELISTFQYKFRQLYERTVDRVRDEYSSAKYMERTVLKPYNKSWFDNIEDVKEEIDSKVQEATVYLESINDEEHKAKLMLQIEAEIEAKKALNGEIPEQVLKFAGLNYLMSYLSDNTDREGCPIPKEECCPSNGTDVIYTDSHTDEPVNIVPIVTEFELDVTPETTSFKDVQVTHKETKLPPAPKPAPVMVKEPEPIVAEPEPTKQDYIDAIEGMKTMLEFVEGQEKQDYLDAIEGMETMLEFVEEPEMAMKDGGEINTPVFIAETKGGKYRFEISHNAFGGYNLEKFKSNSGSGGGSFKTKSQAELWINYTIDGSAKIDGINYNVTKNTENFKVLTVDKTAPLFSRAHLINLLEINPNEMKDGGSVSKFNGGDTVYRKLNGVPEKGKVIEVMDLGARTDYMVLYENKEYGTQRERENFLFSTLEAAEKGIDPKELWDYKQGGLVTAEEFEAAPLTEKLEDFYITKNVDGYYGKFASFNDGGIPFYVTNREGVLVYKAASKADAVDIIKQQYEDFAGDNYNFVYFKTDENGKKSDTAYTDIIWGKDEDSARERFYYKHPKTHRIDSVGKRFKEGGEIPNKKIIVKYIGDDDWHRRLYKSEKGTILASVDGQLHYITASGEPSHPAHGFDKVDPIGEPSEGEKFNYMMLDRLRSDCDYYLGNEGKSRHEKHLWAGNVDGQIKEMKRIWNSLKVKPEWLSMEDIEEYERKMKNEFANGGEVGNDRMYNFLVDDLAKLEKSVLENDKEEIEKFFSYWNIHLKSLALKNGSDRMYNFLKDDLAKLEEAIKENDKEEIDRFFSYWSIHLKSLKYATGGEVGEWKKGTTIGFKTKKEADSRLDLMKNHNESDTEFRDLKVEKIPNTNRFNDKYVVKFEYQKKYVKGGSIDSDMTHVTQTHREDIFQWSMKIDGKFVRGTATINKFSSNYDIDPTSDLEIDFDRTAGADGRQEIITLDFFNKHKQEITDAVIYELGHQEVFSEGLKFKDGGIMPNNKNWQALSSRVKKYFADKYDIQVHPDYLKSPDGFEKSMFGVYVHEDSDVIPNEFRKEILERYYPNTTPLDWDNVQYGSWVSPTIVSMTTGRWLDFLNSQEPDPSGTDDDKMNDGGEFANKEIESYDFTVDLNTKEQAEEFKNEYEDYVGDYASLEQDGKSVFIHNVDTGSDLQLALKKTFELIKKYDANHSEDITYYEETSASSMEMKDGGEVPTVINFRDAGDKAGKNYHYMYNRGKILGTESDNLIMESGKATNVEDIEKVFAIDEDHFMSTEHRDKFVSEMESLFPELTETQIRLALFHDADTEIDGVTHLTISNENPLSSQLRKLTGDTWNATDFEDLEGGELSTMRPFRHIKSGKVFMVEPNMEEGAVGTKYKDGDFVFADIFTDKSKKVPFRVLHFSGDKYYIIGDGSHYVAEEKLSPATEKEFDDYYGDIAHKFKTKLNSGGDVNLDKNVILGETQSGKKVYDTNSKNPVSGYKGWHSDWVSKHKDFTKQDHIDAAQLHANEHTNYNNKWQLAYDSVTADEFNNENNPKGKAASKLMKEMANQASKHGMISHWHDKAANPSQYLEEGGEIEEENEIFISPKTFMNTEIGRIDVYSGLSAYKADATVYYAEKAENNGKSSIFWIINKSDADKLKDAGYTITEVFVKKGQRPYALTTGEIGAKSSYYEEGGEFKNLELELSASPNPDHDRASHSGSVKIKAHKIPVSSYSEARDKAVAFINDNDLGGGNWTGGKIYQDGKVIAHVSYNGRVWEGEKWVSGTKEIQLKQGGSVGFDFNKFSLLQLKEYLSENGFEDIEVSVKLGNAIQASHEEQMRNYYLTAKDTKNIVFSIGDIGKEVHLTKGSENLYASLIVYSMDNKVYTIFFFTKENIKGLKEFLSGIIEKFKQGGELVGTIKGTKKFIFADDSGFVVDFYHAPDGKLEPRLNHSIQQSRTTSILLGEKSLAQKALDLGEEQNLPFDKTLAKLINGKVFKIVYENGGEVEMKDGGKVKSSTFDVDSLVGKALWIPKSANKYQSIVGINVIADDNVKVETLLSSNSESTLTKSYTLQELKDLSKGKKIREDIELITPKMEEGGQFKPQPKFKQGDYVGYKSDSDFTKGNKDLPPMRVARANYNKEDREWVYFLSGVVGSEPEYSLEFRDAPKMEQGGELLPSDYSKEFTLKGNGRRKYSIFQSGHSDAQLRQAAKKLFPSMTKEEHKAKAKEFGEQIAPIGKEYNELVNSEFKKHFGRNYEVTDYKVSGIVRDEFSDEIKNKLRKLISESNQLESATDLHNSMLPQKDKFKVKYKNGGTIYQPELETA